MPPATDAGATTSSDDAGTPVRVAAYDILELPPVEGYTELEPQGMNAHGDVVGFYYAFRSGSGTTHGFVYEAATNVGSEIVDTSANGINDSMAIALTSESRGAAEHGFLLEGAVQTPIGSLSTLMPMSAAVAINRRGWIAGWSVPAGGEKHAVIWDGTSLHDLAASGVVWSVANGLNDSGLVVGAIQVGSELHAAAFQDGGIVDLGTLGGSQSGAVAINEHGRIVGVSGIPRSNDMHAFVYDFPGGPMRDVSPGLACSLRSVNSLGDAVGSCSPMGRFPFAAIWRGGAMVDLNDLIDDPSWMLTGAAAINDRGQIAVIGTHGGMRAALLTPR
jgi:probable HAF family extracellular repeat protein